MDALTCIGVRSRGLTGEDDRDQIMVFEVKGSEGILFDPSDPLTFHTETSYKKSVDEFHDSGMQAGCQAQQVWIEPDELFSVHCLRVCG